MMFSYASAKILGTQFSSDLSIGERAISSMNGFELTWYFYGYSPTYGMLIAGSQIVAALLLLFRKTVRMGAVLLLSFMVNIVLLDVFYEINGATPMAVLLTLMGFFLLLSDWNAFKGYFLKQEKEMHFYKEELPLKFKKIHWFKYILIPVMFIGMFFSIYKLREVYMYKNEFYGAWKVMDTKYDSKIDKVYFELRDRIVLLDTTGKLYKGNLKNQDEVKSTFDIEAKHYSKSLRSFVQKKIDTSKIKGENNIKNERLRLSKLYHKINNSEPVNINAVYKLNMDTLYLTEGNNIDLKLIRIE
ncbi:hypothetical protein QBK95_16525 [Aquimarina sp. 2201CG14-23]|nr:hypothetical protein [Aquimarina sp. 2201CG14-23]